MEVSTVNAHQLMFLNRFAKNVIYLITELIYIILKLFEFKSGDMSSACKTEGPNYDPVYCNMFIDCTLDCK